MLSDEILVAPVVEKGVRSRKVVFPEGKWKGDDGSIVDGGKTIEIQAPLERLPYFKKM
jgi:alpha-glucosidase (family GH31 glycosyl hydrolase)